MFGRRSDGSENGMRDAFYAFVIGSLVGSTVALFFAPTSGRRLRRSVNRKGRQLAATASNSATQALDRAEDAVHRVGEVLENAADEVRRATRSIRGR